MKGSIRTFFLKALCCVPLLLGLAPVYLLSGAYYIPNHILLWILPVLFGYVWAMISYFIRGRMRAVFAFAGLIPIGFIGYYTMTFAADEWFALLPVVCGAAVTLLIPPSFSDALWDEWPASAWIGEAALSLAAQFLTGYAPFDTVSLPVQLCFILLMLMFFLMMNYTSLRISNHGHEKPPASMTRRNRFLTFLLFIPALLIACWGPIARFLSWLWDEVSYWLVKLVMWLSNLFSGENTGSSSGGGNETGAGLMEEAGTSPFWEMMEKALYVVAYIALAAAAVFVIRFLWKRLKRVIRFFLNKLKAYQDSAAEDYTDVAESTMDWDERAEEIRNRIRNFFRRPTKTPWEQLDGQGKVRRLYEQWAEKHHPESALTAREALLTQSGTDARNFADLYDAARYGEKNIAAEQAEEMRKSVRDMK